MTSFVLLLVVNVPTKNGHTKRYCPQLTPYLQAYFAANPPKQNIQQDINQNNQSGQNQQRTISNNDQQQQYQNPLRTTTNIDQQNQYQSQQFQQTPQRQYSNNNTRQSNQDFTSPGS